METSARYTIVGLFTVLSIVAGFIFVFWLHHSGGMGAQAFYWVRFDRPVIGVRPGVSVLFNGLRVGEVREVRLTPADPKAVMALVAVDPATPVRKDTKIDVDSQGLMGSAVVSMVGGSAAAVVPPGTAGQPPLLSASPEAGQTLSQAAKETLHKIDAILGDNAKPLRSAIENISSFAAALARNSDKVDPILAGLERMTSSKPPKQPTIFDLPAPQLAPAKASDAQIAIADPTAMVVYDTQQILLSPRPGEFNAIEGAKWSDTLPKLVQEKMMQSLESAGFARVSQAFEGFEPQYRLRLDIRAFQLGLAPEKQAKVEIMAKIVGKDGQIVATQRFSAAAAAKSANAADATAAIGEAFGKVAQSVADWMRQKI